MNDAEQVLGVDRGVVGRAARGDQDMVEPALADGLGDPADRVVRAVEEGLVQAEVSRQAWARMQSIASGETPIVGVNQFRETEPEQEVALHGYREEDAQAQIARLRKVRRERDPAAVEASLARLRAAALAGENVMPAALEAAGAYASVGEMCGILRDVYGTHRERIRF